MNIKEQHIVGGMTTDMNVSKFDPTKVIYARNIRITQVENNQGLLCVTNEKGTRTCTLTGTGGTSLTIGGTVVGSAFIDNQIVLFTHTSPSTDVIYRLDPNSPTSDFVGTVLYTGNLGFSAANPLETLAVYENENVKKVYWVDGIHQLRCINIMSPARAGDDTQFNANPTLELQQVLSVTKRNSGGEFPAGSIQYAFTYHNQYGPETNVFETSPLYELSPKTKGVAADGRANCSFLISLTETDPNFEYVRAYAIIRTSENGAPSVRLLGDFSNGEITSGHHGITLVDNGMIGSSVDATSLIFIGGEPVAPSTFTVKDNTLFLGNIKLLRSSLGTIEFNTSTHQTIAEKIAAMRDAGTIPLVNSSKSISNVGSGYWFYDYKIDNNRPSTQLRRFKSKENYRLGIIAQHETGIWSEVLWLGDYDNTIIPEFYNEQEAGIFELTSHTGDMATILTKIKNAGYKRIAPVVVYPEGSDRKVFCQGLVSATVYNVEDRFNNRPFSQASWFFRPISEGFGIAALPHASLYPIKTNLYDDSGTAVSNIMGGAELQINSNPRNYGPQVKGYWTGQSATYNALSVEDMVALFGNDYYVDTSIVTLNSPDIDQDDSLQQEDFTGLDFRIVGVAYAGLPSTNVVSYIDVKSGTIPGTALDYSKSRYIKYGTAFGMSSSFNFSGYVCSFTTNDVDLYMPFIVYPWHSSGIIFNDANDGSVSSELNHKIMSNIWFARTVMLNSSTNVNTNTIKLFDDTQSPFVPLGDTADSNVYYGNVDTVKIYKKDSLSSANNSQRTKDFNMKEPKVLGKSTKFENVVRTPNEDNKFLPSTGPLASNSTSVSILGGHVGSLDETLLLYGYERNRNALLASTSKDSPAVPIKYKSTKHAVIPIAPHTGYAGNAITSLYRSDAIHTASGITTTLPFWDSGNAYTFDTGYVPFITEWSSSPNFHKTWSGGKEDYTNTTPEIPTLYIGELYRNFTQEQLNTRFGGNSDKALLNNVWKRCGDSVMIANALVNPSSGGSKLQFVEGDTYLTRYDCLKTYPYADYDVNSIVEIFSTDVETRVNLDARYDNARGLLDNTMVLPTNINLVNRPGYEQTNQLFTYATQDYSKENIDDFPASVAIAGEKISGAEVDNWMSIPMTAVQDLDGAYGPLEYLTTFNDEVYAFQHNGFSQILFNNRVQIPTSDGQPIEISNGMKFQGSRYLSNKIGCSNKWSVCHSNSRLYWYDAGSKDIWTYSSQGLENLSTNLGVKGWVEQYFSGKWSPSNPTGLKTLHEERYNDVYFIGGSVTGNALVYSETLNTFVSLMDYDASEYMYNVEGKSYVLHGNTLHEMWGGAYNSFFGTTKPYLLRFIANAQPTLHKVFDTVQWRSDTWNAFGKYLPNETFNKLKVWNQYQQSWRTGYEIQDCTLTNTPGKPSPLKKKFNTFRALVPRDKGGNELTTTDMRYKGISRIRGNYAVVELKHDANDAYKMQFYDLEIGEFI